MSRQPDRWDVLAGELVADQEEIDTATKVDGRAQDLLAKVLTARQLGELPPPKPVVADWLFADSLAWIQGKWGQAKTFVAVHLACCIGTGVDWHGHKVEPTQVLYIIAESAAGMNQRVEAWEGIHGIDVLASVKFLPVAVQMADPNGVDVHAMRIVLDTLQPGVVFVDTQHRCTVGAEENSSKDMGRFVHALESLREGRGTLFVIVHHEPRQGENLRGSVALEGAATSILRSTKEGDAEPWNASSRKTYRHQTR